MDEALKLWKRWFAYDGDPVYVVDSFSYCFFCGESDERGELKHDEDCIYLEAKKLVEEAKVTDG